MHTWCAMCCAWCCVARHVKAVLYISHTIRGRRETRSREALIKYLSVIKHQSQFSHCPTVTHEPESQPRPGPSKRPAASGPSGASAGSHRSPRASPRSPRPWRGGQVGGAPLPGWSRKLGDDCPDCSGDLLENFSRIFRIPEKYGDLDIDNEDSIFSKSLK